MNGRVTAVIADDEPLAREQLRDLIAEVPWIECVGEAWTGTDALALIDELRPKLVFMDIQMPGMQGLAVVDAARLRPAVIFTTAHDRYAVAAFEAQAIDYLLKPFGRTRFRMAAERARQTLVDRDRLAAAGQGEDGSPTGRPVTRIFVRERGRILPIQVRQIEWLEARGDYIGIYVDRRRYLMQIAMNDIEALLDSDTFMRIHRSHIVNLDFVAKLEPHDSNRLAVTMADGTALIASRARSQQLRELAR